MIERDTNLQEPTNPALNIASVSRCPSINFFNVDCIDFMKSKPDKCYDLAIVDPPYGIGASSKSFINGTSKSKKDYYKDNCWDKEIPTAEYFEQLQRVSKNQIIWGGNYFTDFLKPSRCWIFWDKTIHGNSYADGELAWTSFDKVVRYYRKNICQVEVEGKRRHPTQKTIHLYRWILSQFAESGMNVLDTHGGSMSIAIACELEGFDLDICEIDKEYFEAGVNAFNLHKQQKRLF